MTDVQGRCPACGGASLFLGDGGHVTCRRLDCPNPCAVDDLLLGTDAETTTRVFAALHYSAEQDVTRVIALYERWVKAGPPPLGVSLSRWWDARLVELHNAIRPPQEQKTGCRCHNGDELCSGCRRCPDVCNGCDGPEYSTADRDRGLRP